ncbi:hypothetical protein [Streptomyces sp. Z26]|uniref:hypothetical protein n=1 Tax=Streptomyces sp. Z26 TaxID=2500177 RepID=UPI000EF14024|nr:hypothetical protein [Streptomyces sp. Z26]RLL68158.1 hypothetical protein D7M15_16385 [Streptomyces sp. Z26]
MNTCGLCENDLDTDDQLCGSCATATAARLERLPALHDALTAHMAPAVRGATERVSRGQPGPRMPIDEGALDLHVAHMPGVLEGWREDVQRVRGWGLPVAEGRPAHRVRVAARWLGMTLDWIAADYPAAGELAREVRDLERDALSVVDPEPPEDRGERVGNCPAAYEDGVLCGAVLRRMRGARSISCRWCGAVYPAESWLRLAALIKFDRGAEAS